ncbi:transmembrane protein 71 [Prionailurus viverrinus]|uniref:transmembrane protein 71 n=1 Tax=Prionailurus viverrinus TaxID=61388 RepID=UPI001FF6BF18|nr:transmembrane protein 71 [Prionailurus viverrinus]
MAACFFKACKPRSLNKQPSQDVPNISTDVNTSGNFACDFPDGDSSFEGCSAALLTGSHVTCRRSPRLVSNGYYVWTEDPFLCDKDGNITLSPPQASVLYKENLVRIFRKKKRIRPSFSNLFSLGASKSWQHGNIFGDVDSSLSEDTWLEGVGRLDTHHCNAIGDDRDGSATDAREAEQRKAASSSSHAASRTPPENSHDLALQSQGTTSEHFPENLLDHATVYLPCKRKKEEKKETHSPLMQCLWQGKVKRYKGIGISCPEQIRNKFSQQRLQPPGRQRRISHVCPQGCIKAVSSACQGSKPTTCSGDPTPFSGEELVKATLFCVFLWLSRPPSFVPVPSAVVACEFLRLVQQAGSSLMPTCPRSAWHRAGAPKLADQSVDGNPSQDGLIKTSLWRDIFFQAFLLAACLIICACARCFLGGIFASVVTCPLVITTAYTVTSLFLSLADYFEATACAQDRTNQRGLHKRLPATEPLRNSTSNCHCLADGLPKFANHVGRSLTNDFNLNIQKLSDLQSAWNQLLYWKGVSNYLLRKNHFNLVMCLFFFNLIFAFLNCNLLRKIISIRLYFANASS